MRGVRLSMLLSAIGLKLVFKFPIYRTYERKRTRCGVHVQWSGPGELWGTPNITSECLFPPTNSVLVSPSIIFPVHIDPTLHMAVIELDMSSRHPRHLAKKAISALPERFTCQAGRVNMSRCTNKGTSGEVRRGLLMDIAFHGLL